MSLKSEVLSVRRRPVHAEYFVVFAIRYYSNSFWSDEERVVLFTDGVHGLFLLMYLKLLVVESSIIRFL